MASTDCQAKPVRVSPLIKTTRWGLLIAGYLYASGRWKVLNMIETTRREEWERERPRREAAARVVNEESRKKDLENLLKQFSNED